MITDIVIKWKIVNDFVSIFMDLHLMIVTCTEDSFLMLDTCYNELV